MLGFPKHFIPWSASPCVAEGEPGGLDEGLCCCDCCFWCYMKSTRDEVWVYSGHSLKTKGLGKPGEAPRGAGAAVAVYPILRTQLDTAQEGQREGEVFDGCDKLVL